MNNNYDITGWEKTAPVKYLQRKAAVATYLTSIPMSLPYSLYL